MTIKALMNYKIQFFFFLRYIFRAHYRLFSGLKGFLLIFFNGIPSVESGKAITVRGIVTAILFLISVPFGSAYLVMPFIHFTVFAVFSLQLTL